MPKRACMGKTADDMKGIKQKLDTRPLKDKDMNIMSESMDKVTEKKVVSEAEDAVKEEQLGDIAAAAVAVKSQRKLLSSGQH